MALKLTDKQADLMAEEIASRLAAVMEDAARSDEADVLLDACEKIDPLRAAIRELTEGRTITDLELAADVAGEALSNHRDSAGLALSVIHQVKAGRVVEYRTSDETPDEIIEREQAEADHYAERAALAQAVLWAVRHVEDEAKAAEGDRRAKESLATQERWDQENRRLLIAAGASEGEG